MSGEPAIDVDGLTKYYGQVVGVEDLTFQVGRGEVYGFLGANGAGKTTTMRLMLDLLRPTAGRAAVHGVDCHRDSLAARALIGYLPGELPIYPDLTASAYLDYLARVDGRPVARPYLDSLLERFDVSGTDLSRKLRDQSHGMKQKIGIIQALMAGPPVLILDEPTAGLDPLMIQAFRDVIHDLRREGRTTTFLSSHVLVEVESTCDSIGLVRGGRMVASQTLASLKDGAPRQVTVIFGEELVAGPPAIPGVNVRSHTPREWRLSVSGPLGPLMQALAALPVHDLHIEPFRLDDCLSRLYEIDVTE